MISMKRGPFEKRTPLINEVDWILVDRGPDIAGDPNGSSLGPAGNYDAVDGSETPHGPVKAGPFLLSSGH